MCKGRKPDDKDKEIFLEFLNHVNLEFKKDEEVEKEYEYLCKVMYDLHIEELETLRLAEIVFRSAGLLPNPSNLEELNQDIIDAIWFSKEVIDSNPFILLPLYLYLIKVYITPKEENNEH